VAGGMVDGEVSTSVGASDGTCQLAQPARRIAEKRMGAMINIREYFKADS